MNQLDATLQHSILTLSGQGWSARKIARELDLNQDTVSRYLHLAAAQSKPAIPLAGTPDCAEPKPAIVPIGSKAGRVSHCAPFSDFIERGLEADLSAQWMHQDLVTEQAFTSS